MEFIVFFFSDVSHFYVFYFLSLIILDSQVFTLINSTINALYTTFKTALELSFTVTKK